MKVLRQVEDFFLRPASPRPLAALRIGLGLVLIAQALWLRTSIQAFFANDGLIQGELARALADPGLPRISWILGILAPFHATELGCIQWICAAYLAGLILLVLGVFGRPMVAFCWFLHWMLMNTGQTTNYGVDLYTHVMLFYLIWFPSGLSSPPSSPARLGLRVIQLQLCITYLFSAVEKSRGEQWWNGELLWRALNLPVYRQFDMLWLADHSWIPKVAGLGSLALEFGYFIFIWPKRTRKLWVLGIVSLHLGIAVFLGLTLFGVIMAILTLTAFGISAEQPIHVVTESFNKPMLLFDGVCNMCNSTAAFVLRIDKHRKTALASLQSESGQELLLRHGLPVENFTSLVFIKGETSYLKSSAVIKLLREMPSFWPVLSVLLSLIPRFIRDALYDLIARNRYRLFGKSQVCSLKRIVN